jgi:hypothetical protein
LVRKPVHFGFQQRRTVFLCPKLNIGHLLVEIFNFPGIANAFAVDPHLVPRPENATVMQVVDGKILG